MGAALLRLAGVSALCAWGAALGWAALNVPWPKPRREALELADRLERLGDYAGAARAYRDWLAGDDGLDRGATRTALTQLARAEFKAGDAAAARAALERALERWPDDREIERLRDAVLQGHLEAGASNRYESWRRAGTARELGGSVGVLHVLARGRDVRPWTYRTASRAGTDARLSDEWLEREAARYGVAPPRFEHRWVELAREPFWEAADFPDWKTPYEVRQAWIAAVLERLGASSWPEAFARQFKGRRLDNGVIVFHADAEGRSFALPHQWLSYWDVESAFVKEPLRAAFDFRPAITYAHELLHTFGAGDLYDRVSDPAVPTNDVMYGRCAMLGGCVVSPLSAYAVGWREEPPKLTRLRL